MLFVLAIGIGKVDAQIPKNAISLEDAVFDKTYASRPAPFIKGKLRNISPDELKNTLITYTLVTPFSGKQVKNTAAVLPNGSFELRLDYPLPYQQIWLSIGDLFFAPVYANADLMIDVDVRKVKSSKDEGNFINEGVAYLGTDGPATTYLNRHILFERKKQSAISDQLNELLFMRRNKIIDSALTSFNQLHKELNELDERFIEANPSSYAWIVENERMSQYCAELCLLYKFTGKEMPDTLWQKVKKHKAYVVSNDGTLFYSYMSTYLQSTPSGMKPRFRMADLLSLPDLTSKERIAVDSILLLEKDTNAPTEESKKLRARIQPRITQTSIAHIVNPAIHMFDSIFPPMKADLMKLQLFANYELSDQKLVLESFILPGMHTTWPKTVARAEFAKTNAKLKEINNMLAKSSGASMILPGKALMKTPFGASMYKLSKMPLSTFLANLKASLPGKAIIIDRWATWCAPCISEMPHSKTLSEESKDLPVVFVYLCTENNSSESAWKTKVGELKQPGIHYFIDQVFDNEISSYFSFSGYPGYAFIDTKGRYKPGAIQWMSSIDKNKLTEMLK